MVVGVFVKLGGEVNSRSRSLQAAIKRLAGAEIVAGRFHKVLRGGGSNVSANLLLRCFVCGRGGV